MALCNPTLNWQGRSSATTWIRCRPCSRTRGLHCIMQAGWLEQRSGMRSSSQKEVQVVLGAPDQSPKTFLLQLACCSELIRLETSQPVLLSSFEFFRGQSTSEMCIGARAPQRVGLVTYKQLQQPSLLACTGATCVQASQPYKFKSLRLKPPTQQGSIRKHVT